MKKFTCRVCNSQHLKQKIQAREMMFGTREAFEYEVCATCSSIQIENIPDGDLLARHYPKDFYSFVVRERNSYAKTFLRAQRNRFILGQWSLLGGLLNKLRPVPGLEMLATAGIHPKDRILDIGCGAGATILNELAIAGFPNLLGLDPFIEQDLVTAYGVMVTKQELSEVNGEFDFVMLHHSFEHMPFPRIGLANIRRLLAPGGICLIRVPTPESYAYKKYGVDWVGFDAPRHMFLPSRSGMKLLAEQEGFDLESIFDEGSRLQFTGSELYLRNIPLHELDEQGHFTESELVEFDRLSRELNTSRQGDCLALVLRKPRSSRIN